MGDALELMCHKGVRRVPVLTHTGALTGILTIDGLLDISADQLGDVVHAIERARVRETRIRH